MSDTKALLERLVEAPVSRTKALSAQGSGKEAEVTNLTGKAKAGVDLAKRVLWFIAGAALLILALIVLEEFAGTTRFLAPVYQSLGAIAAKPPAVDDVQQNTNFQKSVDAAKALIEAVGTQQRDTRDFVIKVAQLILLTLLLPVLTALLGYIFGTQQADRDSGTTPRRDQPPGDLSGKTIPAGRDNP